MNKPYLFRLCLLVATLIALTAQLTAAQTGNAPGTVAHAETNFLNPEGTEYAGRVYASGCGTTGQAGLRIGPDGSQCYR